MARPPSPHVAASPEGFDPFILWLDGFSQQLVLLEEFPLTEVCSAVEDARARVALHLSEFGLASRLSAGSLRARELSLVIDSDHRWFETSLAEWSGLLGVVKVDDHGGHRQALGQYGRLLAAALTRHRRDELELEQLGAPPVGRPLRNAN